ncbi:MAG: hypothetical protein QXY52_00130 [Conexivisphaerales archaeon]
MCSRESQHLIHDGTGHSLTIKKNYESYAQKLNDMAKVNKKKRQLFVHTFTIMDLKDVHLVQIKKEIPLIDQ